MVEFTLKPNDIPINITPEQKKEIVKLTLSMFDDDWVHCIASIKSRYNLESESIQNTLSKLGKLRDVCGDINNKRISLWQQEYFKLESIEKQSKRTINSKSKRMGKYDGGKT